MHETSGIDHTSFDLVPTFTKCSKYTVHHSARLERMFIVDTRGRASVHGNQTDVPSISDTIPDIFGRGAHRLSIPFCSPFLKTVDMGNQLSTNQIQRKESHYLTQIAVDTPGIRLCRVPMPVYRCLQPSLTFSNPRRKPPVPANNSTKVNLDVFVFCADAALPLWPVVPQEYILRCGSLEKTSIEHSRLQ